MFRLPGIFRTVSLTSTARVQVRDFRVFPDLDADYKNGSIRIEADICNLSDKVIKGYSISYSLYSNKVYSDENIPVENVAGTVPVTDVKKGDHFFAKTIISIDNPKNGRLNPLNGIHW